MFRHSGRGPGDDERLDDFASKARRQAIFTSRMRVGSCRLRCVGRAWNRSGRKLAARCGRRGGDHQLGGRAGQRCLARGCYGDPACRGSGLCRRFLDIRARRRPDRCRGRGDRCGSGRAVTRPGGSLRSGRRGERRCGSGARCGRSDDDSASALCPGNQDGAATRNVTSLVRRRRAPRPCPPAGNARRLPGHGPGTGSSTDGRSDRSHVRRSELDRPQLAGALVR